jgi:hypothetical protein
MSSYHMCGCICYSKNECSLALTNVGYMARFPEKANGLPPSEREAVGFMKNRRPNHIQLTNVQ